MGEGASFAGEARKFEGKARKFAGKVHSDWWALVPVSLNASGLKQDFGPTIQKGMIDLDHTYADGPLLHIFKIGPTFYYISRNNLIDIWK